MLVVYAVKLGGVAKKVKVKIQGRQFYQRDVDEKVTGELYIRLNNSNLTILRLIKILV